MSDTDSHIRLEISMKAHQHYLRFAPGSTFPRSRALWFFGAFARLAFWLGVVLCVVGNLITFVPGGEESWFAFAGILVLVGAFIPRWYYRVGAVALAVFCAYASMDGHERGIQYRQRLEQRRATHSLVP